ncbi:hypothetical protein ANME2D_00623 [Candidatus Methanoperedens nitroreducens]|uniref:Uncharacterized protein n=1 Tax=Candidatus Methanoperedens nitratireducens TaxID=1392998 RepID=A0A062V8D3_9EURY|nr:hypothetical protein [Candidatus Methanoperedens nitroreducens]KCZ73552.1 hypothetical protein ANME2D_00623 [Candidatus Methanoperedens nitroreducens]MDJ1422488.1 hypothetical protein [Candidatus Methanoperedens sp.]
MVYLIIDVIHFIVSSILLTMAIRSFLKTRITAMLYLTMGFAFITFGHLFSDIYFIDNVYMDKLYSEIFDIIGLILLIIAVKKS